MANKILATLLVNAAVFSALFLVMLPVRRLLGKRLSPAAMLVLWAVLAVKLVIPFGFESKLSLFPAQPAVIQAEQPAQAGADALDAAQMKQLSNGTQKVKATAQPAPVASAAPAAGNLAAMETPATQAAATTRPIDWPLLLLGLWAAGALAAGAALLAGAVNLRRRVRHARTDVPAHVRHAFEECRQALGIRRAVGLAVSAAPGVPVVMGALRPMLVLPGDACRLDKQSLRHVLTHELTHVRRGDLWALRLMNVLCAVYWFAPTVWLCGRLVRADIETACDHGVLRVLGGGERLAYVATILRFTGRPAVNRLAAAMGMGDGRPAMEQRIRGMYRSARMDWKGRAAAAAVAGLLVITSLLTACQPTPTDQYVKNKKDDSFLNQLITPGSTAGNGGTGAASGATVAPEDNIFRDYAKNWTATIAVKPHPITVTIDADVVTPAAAGLPVYTVEPEKLTQERIDGFLSQFGDVPYHLDMDIKTKSYYQEQILRLQAQLVALADSKDTEGQKARQRKDMENAIRLAQQDMLAAPDGADDVIEPKFTNKYIIMRDSDSAPSIDENGNLETPPPGAMTAKEKYESTHTEAIAVKWAYDGASMSLYATRSDDLVFNGFSFAALRGGASLPSNPSPAEALAAVSASTHVISNTGDLKGLKTTYAQARALAEQAVAKLGIDYMALAQSAKEIKYADLRNAVNYRDTSAGFTDFRKLDYTDVDYVFYFTRSVGGVNETYCSDGIGYRSQYDEPWPYERLTVVVDDTGVRQIGWSGGTKPGRQLASNSKLLPFDQIQKIAQRQFTDGNIRIYGYTYEEDAAAFNKNLVKMEVNIDRVVLGYARVKLNDNSGGYALVPAWDFFGSDAYYDDADPNQPSRIKYSMEDTYGYAHSYLTINAIDGSVINRSLGY